MASKEKRHERKSERIDVRMRLHGLTDETSADEQHEKLTRDYRRASRDSGYVNWSHSMKRRG